MVPTIIEPSSLAADFADIRGIMTRLESKIVDYITRVPFLEAKLVATPDLQKTPDSLLLSLSVKVQQLSTRLTHCVTKFYNYKKYVHVFFAMRTPFYINSSNIPTSSQDHDVPMSFRLVLEKIGNPLDPFTNQHFQIFLTQYNK